MKLSEIKGARTFDVIAEIIEPIASIAEDKELAELFKREKAPEGVNPRDIAVKRLKKNVPHLLKAHKPEMIAIMAAIEGISAAEYETKLNLVNFIKDFTELLTDDAFIALFTSAQSGKTSGSALVTSKAKA